MILNIVIEERTIPVDVPDDVVSGSTEFFAKMDADMDAGWQMSRTWVEKPDEVQRCQIVCDKILGAFETENKQLLLLMTAYLLYKKPGLQGVIIDTNGEMDMTELVFEQA